MYSTTYPFRIPGNDMVCVYCCEPFDEPNNYREHMKCHHSTFNVDTAFAHIVSMEEFVKADCTEIVCRLCSIYLDSVTSVAEHLYVEHGKKINRKAQVGLQVFKLGKERWVCAICNHKFPSLRALSRHNSGHYHKYTCETCGKSYLNKENLNKHILFGHSQEKLCVKCRKSFPNCEARRLHVLASRRCWPFACNMCGERFITRKLKVTHQMDVHSVNTVKKCHSCPECHKTFDEWRQYRAHFIISHTNSNYVCAFCQMKFDNKASLENHRVIHTKEKLFHCNVCSKSFVRKKNLVQHMWIHNEHKRFECIPCNKKFNQRVSWKTHMRSHHPEMVDALNFT